MSCSILLYPPLNAVLERGSERVSVCTMSAMAAASSIPTSPPAESTSGPSTSAASYVVPSAASLSSSTSSAPLPPFSHGLYLAVAPAVEHCDDTIKRVFTSQQELAQHIDALSTALESFRALSRLPTFAAYTTKLQNAKKRIKRLQVAVDKISGRVDDIRSTIRRKEGLTPKSARKQSALNLPTAQPATPQSASPRPPPQQSPTSTTSTDSNTDSTATISASASATSESAPQSNNTPTPTPPASDNASKLAALLNWDNSE